MSAPGRDAEAQPSPRAPGPEGANPEPSAPSGDNGEPEAQAPGSPQAPIELPAPYLPPDPSSVAGLLDLLVRDLQRALYSELGAFSVYVLLPRWTRQRDLLPLLRQMAEDERQIITGVRGLIERLGGKAPKRRWSRSLAAWGLWLATPVMGLPFALRLCREAESSVSRWYAQHTVLLYQLGRLEEAQDTRAWSQTKHVHAVRLGAFIDHLRRGE